MRKLSKMNVLTRARPNSSDREATLVELDKFFTLEEERRETVMKRFREAHEAAVDFPTDSAALKEHMRVADLSSLNKCPDMKALIKTIKESKDQVIKPEVNCKKTGLPDWPVANLDNPARKGVNAHKYRNENHEVELGYTLLK